MNRKRESRRVQRSVRGGQREREEEEKKVSLLPTKTWSNDGRRLSSSCCRHGTNTHNTLLPIPGTVPEKRERVRNWRQKRTNKLARRSHTRDETEEEKESYMQVESLREEKSLASRIRNDCKGKEEKKITVG